MKLILYISFTMIILIGCYSPPPQIISNDDGDSKYYMPSMTSFISDFNNYTKTVNLVNYAIINPKIENGGLGQVYKFDFYHISVLGDINKFGQVTSCIIISDVKTDYVDLIHIIGAFIHLGDNTIEKPKSLQFAIDILNKPNQEIIKNGLAYKSYKVYDNLFFSITLPEK